MSDNQKLKELFYNTKKGLVSLEKLKKKAREEGIGLSYKDIEKFYKEQSINNLLKPVRKPKNFNSIVANYPSHIYQMDIINYQRYKYHNYQYILVIIDIYSRYTEARAMTNRRMQTIIKNFKEIMEVMGPPYKIQCDNEFNKKEFINVLETYNINVSFSDPYEINKNAIVERVNATILMLLQKIRLTTNAYDWNKYLPDVIENYNDTYHSTIKNKPFDVFVGDAFNEQDIINVKNEIEEGDKVRKVIKKEVFDKIDKVNLSKEVYTVEKVNKNKIKLFEDNKFYKPYELKITYEI